MTSQPGQRLCWPYNELSIPYTHMSLAAQPSVYSLYLGLHENHSFLPSRYISSLFPTHESQYS
jgi:hypothetical protein